LDNLTHSLVGWTLGQTGLKRKTRKGLAALMMGANAPDIDVFFGWVPWEPLAMHRGVTHSLVAGLWIMPVLTAGFLWLLDRWQVRRGVAFASGLEMHFGWLLALAFAGCLTHPLLDWQTVYAVQLLSPLDLRWFHTDSLFIIDVRILVALGLGIWLSRRREGRGASHPARPARIALAFVGGYIVLNAGIGMLARQAAQSHPPYALPDVIVASPPPLPFWPREVVWRQDGAIWRGAYNPFVSLFRLESYSGPEPDGMNDPRVRRAARDPAARKFLAWSILPVATVTETTCGTMVRFADARFSGFGSSALSRTVFMPTGGTGCSP
jgi:inner membrane protein